MLPKLSHLTLSDMAAESILGFISDVNLGPGDTLPSETRLAQQFGVSRPIIREALKALAGRDVIEIVNGRGAVIKPLNGQLLNRFFERAVILRPRSLVELMEVRKGLEVESAALAAARRSPEDLAVMRRTVDAMADVVHEAESFANLDVSFHLQIAAASRNDMLYYLIESIRESLRDTILEGLRLSIREEQLREAVEIHHRILEQLERADVSGATQQMNVHFDNAIMTILKDSESKQVETGERRAMKTKAN